MNELKKDNTEYVCVCSQTDFDIDVQKRNLSKTTSVKHEIKHATQVVDMFVIVLWSLPLHPLVTDL